MKALVGEASGEEDNALLSDPPAGGEFQCVAEPGRTEPEERISRLYSRAIAYRSLGFRVVGL